MILVQILKFMNSNKIHRDKLVYTSYLFYQIYININNDRLGR